MAAGLPERLTKKIHVAADGCWRWTGAVKDKKRPKPYGSVWDPSKRRSVCAHRLVWEVLVGVIPEGHELDHLCRNTLCVNPAHLEPVTHKENVYRGAVIQGDRDFCKRGHARTPEDSYYSGGRRKWCRPCQLELKRERYHRKTSATR